VRSKPPPPEKSKNKGSWIPRKITLPLKPKIILQLHFSLRRCAGAKRRKKLLHLDQTGREAAQRVHQRHQVVPLQLQAGVEAGRRGQRDVMTADGGGWEENLQRRAYAMGLQFSPEATLVAVDAVHDAGDVEKVRPELLLQLQHQGVAVLWGWWMKIY